LGIPIIEARGNIYILRWLDEQLTCTVSRLATHSDRVTCELLFETTDPLYYPHLFHTAHNLVATRSKITLAKQLADAYDKLDADQSTAIIEQLCFKVLQKYRTGEEPVELMTNAEIKKTTFKIYPFIIENEANLIFGDGGSGKSYIVPIFVILIQLPYEDNPLKLTPKSGRVLWLDWETSQANMEKRLNLLTTGFGLPAFFIKYRYCSQRLADDIEAIQKICLEDSIDTVVIDSMGMACGGDINDAEIANQFFTAYRSLNATGIFVHHSSKADMQKRQKRPTPIGSIYFYNYPRNIWECRASQEIGSNQLTVGLFHRKCNVDRFHKPLAYTLTFTDDRIMVVPDDIKNIPEFGETISLSSQILDALKAEKKRLAVSDLTNLIDAKEDSIRKTLTRLRKAEKVVHLPDQKWGLPYLE